MEVKLESLIEQIKKDGIQEAQKQAQHIIEEARTQAEAIVEGAKSEANNLLKRQEQAIRKRTQDAEAALQQAARDVVLSVREKIVSLCDRILKENVSQALSPEFMAQLITTIVERWSAKQETIEVLVSKNDQKKLQELLLSQLQRKAKEGIEIKVSSALENGFRIGIRGSDLHYDFTAEAIAQVLKEFLNPSISALLDSQSDG